jgi:hypothetical protein
VRQHECGRIQVRRLRIEDGITIHYEGTAKSERDLSTALAIARQFANTRGWLLQEVLEEDGILERVVNEEEADYAGRVQGVVLFPHEDAEPFELLFGDDLFMQSYIKTQFAGAQAHVAVIQLLQALAPHFETLGVIDEGEYWDTSDAEALESLLAGCNAALAELLRSNPNASTRVRLPSGRIVDALE